MKQPDVAGPVPAHEKGESGEMNRFTTNARIETRALNIQAELSVSAISGKGVNSGWSKVKDGMRALGFRFSGDMPAGLSPDEQSARQEDEAATLEGAGPVGDSISVHVPDATRADLIRALTTMPDEAFQWLLLHLAPGPMRPNVWPDGLGGFREESRTAIAATRDAATKLLEG